MSIEIELAIADLKAVLPGLSKVVNRSSNLLVLGCVRACVADGEVTLQVTNLDDTATVSMGRCGAGSGSVLVPFEELNKAIKGCAGEQCLRLSAKKDESVLNYPIGASRADRKLTFMDPAEWPESPSQMSEPPISVTSKLKEALLHALDCSSEDESRYILQGAFLDARDATANYVVGTNGHVLFSANSFQFGLKESLIVPNRKFLHWRGFIDDNNCELSSLPHVEAVVAAKGIAKVEGCPGWLQFKSDRWTFVTRQIEGQYPNWKQVIPAEWKAKVVLSSEAIQFIQGVVFKMPCPDSADMPVYLVVENGTLALSSRVHASDPWTTLPVFGAVVEGAAVTVALNRNFVAKAMALGLDEMTLIDELSPVIFKKDGSRLVVMTLRLEGSPTNHEKPAEIEAAAPTEVPVPAAEVIIITQPQELTSGATTPEPQESSSMPKESIIEPPQPKAIKGNQSAFDQLQQTVENIKTTLKDAISNLNDLSKTVSQAYREKRTTDKEIEAIRDSLNEIRKLKI